jgi:tripartite-type tricarboxylate transporter receptor subunit TctC
MLRLLTLTLAFVAATCAARAQDYPTRPIRFIVPFAAGGGSDAQSRIWADVLSKALGQGVAVENMGGGGGTIGVRTVARAAPDGYTILSTTPSFTINPYIQKDVDYDPAADFEPVIQTTTSPIVLVVPKASELKSVKDVIDLARAKPGQVFYGTAGVGSIAHLSSALFASLAKVDLVHVPYRGTGPALIDLLGGRLQVQFENAPGVLPQITSGELRAIAVGTAQKSKILPDLPTIAETVPGYESSSWFGIMVPAKTPRAVVDKLNAAINKGLADPEVQKKLDGLGVERIGGTPEAFGTYLKARIADMKVIAKAANLTPQ